MEGQGRGPAIRIRYALDGDAATRRFETGEAAVTLASGVSARAKVRVRKLRSIRLDRKVRVRLTALSQIDDSRSVTRRAILLVRGDR